MYGYIYETTNLINGKKYIGQKKSDVFLDTKYLGSGKFIQLAINKYGKENFKIRLIEECDSRELLDSREIYWINYYNAVKDKNYYNISKGGEHWNLSSEYIAETNRKHQSKKMKGRFYIHRNYDEEKLIFLEDLNKYLQEGWIKGRCQKSKDTIKRKTKEAMSNYNFTDGQRYRMGSANRDKHLSEETRKKMSDYWKGRPKPSSKLPKSEETRKKMSESAKLRYRRMKGE